jgi:hypothetical protein
MTEAAPERFGPRSGLSLRIVCGIQLLDLFAHNVDGRGDMGRGNMHVRLVEMGKNPFQHIQRNKGQSVSPDTPYIRVFREG